MLYITFKLLAGFIILFIIIRFVGRKIINQITPFTFIGSIVIGEFLGNAVYEEHVSVLEILYSISLWGLMLFIVEYLERKFLFFRGIVLGKPSALIKNGVIDREELKKCRMNLNQLQSMLRQNETFSVREVAYCYLESNGSLSILKKSQYQKTKKEDFTLPEKAVHVPVTLIRDGKVLKDELTDIGFDETWLKKQLATHNISKYKDVFLAEWLEGDGIFVQKL
ncbi:DUF421 domain-containing protein [Rummeliibacillus pycnus]|uniref:DUF421 domain-containing protein n=1 Tax=Rummeliibacillus pycnus TaxID=101070 RepID=UPI003D27160C